MACPQRWAAGRRSDAPAAAPRAAALQEALSAARLSAVGARLAQGDAPWQAALQQRFGSSQVLAELVLAEGGLDGASGAPGQVAPYLCSALNLTVRRGVGARLGKGWDSAFGDQGRA